MSVRLCREKIFKKYGITATKQSASRKWHTIISFQPYPPVLPIHQTFRSRTAAFMIEKRFEVKKDDVTS